MSARTTHREKEKSTSAKERARARREKNGFGVTDENGYFSNDASRAEKKKERRIKGRY